MIEPVDYPALVLALTNYACNGTKGRPPLDDKVYEAVTEGRQAQTELMRQHQKMTGVDPKKWAFYSSCADLCHWLYCRLGIDLPWVNREESKHYDGEGWEVGKNIALLSTLNPLSRPCTITDTYYPGDVLHIGTPGANNDHVMIVRADNGTHVEVAEYGQPGGAIHTHELIQAKDSKGLACYKMGARQLLSYLRLTECLDAADAQGKLLPITASDFALAESWE